MQRRDSHHYVVPLAPGFHVFKCVFGSSNYVLLFEMIKNDPVGGLGAFEGLSDGKTLHRSAFLSRAFCVGTPAVSTRLSEEKVAVLCL